MRTPNPEVGVFVYPRNHFLTLHGVHEEKVNR